MQFVKGLDELFRIERCKRLHFLMERDKSALNRSASLRENHYHYYLIRIKFEELQKALKGLLFDIFREDA